MGSSLIMYRQVPKYGKTVNLLLRLDRAVGIMSIGNMSSRIDIIRKNNVKDAEGISRLENTVVSIRAYREGRPWQ